MASASIKQVADFFKTGDPERDTLTAFSKEWKQLDDDTKAEVKALVGESLGL
jgi:hypothetical protein